MTTEQIKQTAQVWQWLAEGKKVQRNRKRGDNLPWYELEPPYFHSALVDVFEYEYRLAPEPLRCWVNVTESQEGLAKGMIFTTHFHTKEAAEQDSLRPFRDKLLRVAVELREVTE